MSFNIKGLITLVETGLVKPTREDDDEISLKGEGLHFELMKIDWGRGRFRRALREVVDDNWRSGRVTLGGIRQRDLKRLEQAIRATGGGASKLITEKVEARTMEQARGLIAELSRPGADRR